MRVAFVFFMLFLVGCAEVSLQSRMQYAANLADQAGWKMIRIPTESFILTAYVPRNDVHSETLTVYIEGDGLSWLTRSQVSNDPTPRNPIGLELALRHQKGMAVYLARPCQYVDTNITKSCKQTYWTSGRFGPKVIEANTHAISILKKRMGAKRLIFVGYSGGGAVATLVAAQRTDVIELITVAGNLDHRVWTKMHKVPALKDSLNPADAWQSLIQIPQRHFVGGLDQIVDHKVSESFVSRFPEHRRPKVIVIPNFNHVCCWVQKWGSIYDGQY